MMQKTGVLFVDGLDTGNYFVKQTKVEEGYKLLDGVIMWVYHNQISEINLAEPVIIV